MAVGKSDFIILGKCQLTVGLVVPVAVRYCMQSGEGSEGLHNVVIVQTVLTTQ